jgi:hypothetical protein
MLFDVYLSNMANIFNKIKIKENEPTHFSGPYRTKYQKPLGASGHD